MVSLLEGDYCTVFHIADCLDTLENIQWCVGRTVVDQIMWSYLLLYSEARGSEVGMTTVFHSERINANQKSLIVYIYVPCDPPTPSPSPNTGS